MRYITMFIIIFVIVCFLLMMDKQNTEHLENIPSNKDDSTQDKLKKQKAQGANLLGNNRTQQLDELYENTDTYENEEGRQGLDICLEYCKSDKGRGGNCVEFGITGKAFCFK